MEEQENLLETSTTETQSVAKPKMMSQQVYDLLNDPDFGISPNKSVDYVMKEYTSTLHPDDAKTMVEKSGIKSSFGEQVAVGVQNMLASISTVPDYATLVYGNIKSNITGEPIGKEFTDVAYENIQKRLADIGYNAEAIGGITNQWAGIVNDALSFGEIALLGIATAGLGSLAQITIQEMGEGFYADMQDYYDTHGSFEGYIPKGGDVALNIGNALLQAGIEYWAGFGSPRFLVGGVKGFFQEGVSGAIQEGLQAVIHDLNEYAKGNIEFQKIIDEADQYMRAAAVGGAFQGTVGAITYGAARSKADYILAKGIAKNKGRIEPNQEDRDIAKKLNDLKEREYGSALAEEFKKRFDATSPVGQLQQKIATAINDAAKAQNLDMGLSETQLAQRIESIAAQETMNAMEDSAERRQSISAHELNNITYKDGALWLAGTTPETGARSINLAKVLEQRQGIAGQSVAQDREAQKSAGLLFQKDTAKGNVPLDNTAKKVRELKNNGSLSYNRNGISFSVIKTGNSVTIDRIENGKAVSTISIETKDNTVSNIHVFEEKDEGQHYASSLLYEAERIFGDLQAIPTPSEKAQKFWEHVKYTEINQETKKQQRKTYQKDTIVVDGVERPIENSLGGMIARTEQGLINFWRWFGNSKVVDKDGKPLVVYHGTSSKFDTFDINKSGKNTGTAIYGQGFYFTTDKEVAIKWGAKRGEPIVVSAYVKLENPNMVEELEYPKDSREKGFDGVIAKVWGTKDLEIVAFESNQIKSTDNKGVFDYKDDNMLYQAKADQSRLDKGDTYRGAYDEKLKRIILNEKSDLTTIQHEFAHYWIQNNFAWYRSGLASDEWKRNWERVESALGIEPTDKYLSKVASEKFARAYERYIMEGKVAPEYQWAFAEFQEFYNEVYEDLKAEYFDLNEELSPELIDWFNRQRPVAPEQVAEMRQNQVRSAIAQAPDNTIIESVGDGYAVVEENEQGEIESTIVVPKETITEEQFGVPAKKTKSGLQESLRKRFGDDVNVDELVALDSVETLAQAESIIASNPQLAWEQMLTDSTNDVKRAYLYKAFAKMAENDPQIAVDLSNTNMAQWAREKGQAIQALNINDELGLSPHTILAYMQNAKGKMSQEQLAQALNEIDLYAELSAEDITSLKNETECLL